MGLIKRRGVILFTPLQKSFCIYYYFYWRSKAELSLVPVIQSGLNDLFNHSAELRTVVY